MSSAAKVGFVTLLAAAILVFALFQLGFLKHHESGVTYYVVFGDVGGLQKDSLVRLSGVMVGKVTNLDMMPDNRVKVTFLITRPDLKLPMDSMMTVSSSFMGDRVLEITPRGSQPAVPGQTFIGTSPITMYQILEESQEVMGEMKKLGASINKVMGDAGFQENIKLSMRNLKDITANLRTTTGNLDARISMVANQTNGLIKDARVELHATGSNLRDFSKHLKEITVSNQNDIRVIVMNLKDTSVSLKKTLKTVEELVTRQEVSDNVLATLQNIRETSEQVKGIAQDIHTLTSDGNMQQQLKETIANAKEASEGAKQVVNKLKHILGVKKNGSSDSGLIELKADVEWNKANGQNNPNLNLTVLPGCPTSVRVGVDSVGYSNLVNAELEKKYGNFSPHIGVIRSKFGIGAKQYIGSKANVYVDAYNTRDVQVDFMGNWEVAGGFYLLGGVRDAFDQRNTVFGVGRRF